MAGLHSVGGRAGMAGQDGRYDREREEEHHGQTDGEGDAIEDGPVVLLRGQGSRHGFLRG